MNSSTLVLTENKQNCAIKVEAKMLTLHPFYLYCVLQYLHLKSLSKIFSCQVEEMDVPPIKLDYRDCC